MSNSEKSVDFADILGTRVTSSMAGEHNTYEGMSSSMKNQVAVTSALQLIHAKVATHEAGGRYVELTTELKKLEEYAELIKNALDRNID